MPQWVTLTTLLTVHIGRLQQERLHPVCAVREGSRNEMYCKLCRSTARRILKLEQSSKPLYFVGSTPLNFILWCLCAGCSEDIPFWNTLTVRADSVRASLKPKPARCVAFKVRFQIKFTALEDNFMFFLFLIY